MLLWDPFSCYCLYLGIVLLQLLRQLKPLVSSFLLCCTYLYDFIPLIFVVPILSFPIYKSRGFQDFEMGKAQQVCKPIECGPLMVFSTLVAPRHQAHWEFEPNQVISCEINSIDVKNQRYWNFQNNKEISQVMWKFIVYFMYNRLQNNSMCIIDTHIEDMNSR